MTIRTEYQMESLRLLSERPTLLLRFLVIPWLAQALDLGKAKSHANLRSLP